MGIWPILTVIVGVFAGGLSSGGSPDWFADLARQRGYFTTQALQLLLIAAVLTQAHRIRVGRQENHRRETRTDPGPHLTWFLAQMER